MLQRLRAFCRLGPVLAIAAFLLVATSAAQPAGSSLGDAIDRILDADQTANAWWGVQVIDLETGSVLHQRNAERSFVPASVTKLFTTAAALERLGPSYTYRTELYIDGTVVDGRLEGDLIVRGSGDPTIGGEFSANDRTALFRAWADSLRAAGVSEVQGDIIGDDDIFDDTALGENWSWDDEPYAYAAAVSGLSFHDNVVDVTIASRAVGRPGRVSWRPHGTDYVDIVNRTVTVARRSALREGYHRDPGTNHIELFSRVPAGSADLESLSVHNPTGYFAHVLREILVTEGLVIAGAPVDVDDLVIKPDYSRARRVAHHISAPLSEISAIINKESQNLYAEQVLRTLGVEAPQDAPADIEPGSARMGILAAMPTFAAAGVDTSRLQIVDGSGLSRKNLVTPRMTAALLEYMARHEDAEVRDAFLASLPVGGRDGTLETRFPRGSAAHGRVRAKTGTLGNVSSLAGYAASADGAPLAFVLFCNHYTVESRVVSQAQDRVVMLLATARQP